MTIGGFIIWQWFQPFSLNLYSRISASQPAGAVCITTFTVPAILSGRKIWTSSKTFPGGEFVVTTLYAAKDDAAFANRCLKLLINNHVAAIAIKDLYYDDLSDDIKNYADQHHVPILFFSNLYIDDIIVAIRNELSDNLHTTLSNSIFQALIFDRNQNAFGERISAAENQLLFLFRYGPCGVYIKKI